MLHKQNKPGAALQEIERMSAEDPRDPGLRNLRAVVLARIGEYRESIQIYADLVGSHPREPAIWMSYGHALASAGRDRDSAAAYRRCIELAPHCGEAYWSLANLKTFEFSEHEASAMVAQLARAGFGTLRADPIFIVGLPRAGSTLIEQILASHSAVEGTMELPDIISIARRLGGKQAESSKYPEALAALSAADCTRLGDEYLERTKIQRKTQKRFFIDKMPNNFLHIGLIRLALPNAKIIDARRHPMACCFSGFKQHFARGQRYTYSLEEIGRYYRDYAQLMDHFDAALPGKIHRVLYETLVEDTETEIRRLLEYCGSAFEAECLRFHENRRAVRTASAQQVRKPMYREGLDQWRHFDPWLAPLREALGPVLDAYPGVASSLCNCMFVQW